MDRDELLTIGTLAARTGVAVSAVRFYEKKGLISSVRTESGHRRFHRSTIRRLSVIIVCQRLGYSLGEIHERLGLLPDDRIPADRDWAGLSAEFRSEIDGRIEALLTLRDHLDGCIGCGCISLEVCMLYNPDDAAADLGPGPRYLLGDTSADLGPDLGPAHPAAVTGDADTPPLSDPEPPPSPEPTITVSDQTDPDHETPDAAASDVAEGAAGHPNWHLAQINIGRLHHPVDDPRTAEFMDNLDPINELAESSPGFVWRLQDEQGNATAIRAFDDDTILPNLSVWTSIEALKDYVFRSDHARFLRRRREWFAPMDDLPVLTMWWVPAGHLPTMAEAKERIEHLAEHGPTAHAFTFHPLFEPPATVVG